MTKFYSNYKNNQVRYDLTGQLNPNSNTGSSLTLCAGGICKSAAPDAPGWTPGWNWPDHYGAVESFLDGLVTAAHAY